MSARWSGWGQDEEIVHPLPAFIKVISLYIYTYIYAYVYIHTYTTLTVYFLPLIYTEVHVSMSRGQTHKLNKKKEVLHKTAQYLFGVPVDNHYLNEYLSLDKRHLNRSHVLLRYHTSSLSLVWRRKKTDLNNKTDTNPWHFGTVVFLCKYFYTSLQS